MFGSKRTTSISESTETTNIATDNRLATGDGAVMGGNVSVSGEGNRVTTTDHGAIAMATGMSENVSKKAMQTAGMASRDAIAGMLQSQERSYDFADNTVDRSLNFSGDVAKSANNALSNAVNKIGGVVKDANRSDIQTAMQFGSLALAAIGVAWAIWGRK